jgi:hypothetical protein
MAIVEADGGKNDAMKEVPQCVVHDDSSLFFWVRTDEIIACIVFFAPILRAIRYELRRINHSF